MQAVKGQASAISSDRHPPFESGADARREMISFVNACGGENGKNKHIQELVQITCTFGAEELHICI